MNKKELIISKLRKKRVKVTPQRIAIIDYLEEFKNHPTAEDIYLAILKNYPALSLATVYNTLDKLEEIDEVFKLKITEDNKVNYEYDHHPHHHFYCKKCKNIFDINIECEISKKENIDGHMIEETFGHFKGICKNCMKK